MSGVSLALVLAAGEGSRLGGPKALVPWQGNPLALAHAEAARAAGCAAVRVVVRADVARALPTAPAGVRWVVSAEDPMLGPAGSLRAAAREGLGDGLVAVSPVDLDPAAWRCVSALAEALIAHGADVAKPAFGGRRGHPVVVRAAVLAGYARGDAAPLREVLRAAAWRAVEVPVDDAAVLGDFDTPEALARGRVRA